MAIVGSKSNLIVGSNPILLCCQKVLDSGSQQLRATAETNQTFKWMHSFDRTFHLGS